jgi:predicted restriction endonuclease
VSLADVTADAVLAALAEHDSLGQQDFLTRYGFRPARKFVLIHEGRSYDSKAILGAAHQHATGQPLPAANFNGGEQTITRLLGLGFDVRDTSASPIVAGTIGEVPGVAVGTTYTSRREAADAGVHRAIQAGIVGTGATGAESIVVSGGYEDDIDHGWEIVYTGHGGRDASGLQVSDQSFESPGNAALQTSMLTGAPVRVIRGAHRGSAHAPSSGYRYDGLYFVEKAWRPTGRSGFLICRYRMVSADTPPAAVHNAEPSIPRAPDGTTAPERRTSITQRLVRSIQVAEYVKTLHDHTCQTCGVRLAIGPRAYSEGAHVRALGSSHEGPDVPANMLCLCPNCHVLFDNGALLISEDLAITVNGELSGVLRTHPSHVIAREHLEYHRSIHE